MRKIFDDRTDLGCFQRLALNLCTYRVQAGRRRGGRDRDIASGWFGEAAKGRFCHAELVWPDQIVIVCQQQSRKQALRIPAQLNTTEAAKHFGAKGGRPARDHDHVLAAGVEIDPASLELWTK